MNTNAYDFVHLAIHAMGDTVQGKTKLQKTIYFLGIMTGCLDSLGYRAHYYGPYSDKVADAVGTLRALGFVDANCTTWGFDSQGFEKARTDYSLNDDGRKIAKNKTETLSDLWSKLESAADTLKKVGDTGYMKMSIAAKTYFILSKHNGDVTLEQITKTAKKFDWKVTDDEVNEAACFLEALELAQRKSA